MEKGFQKIEKDIKYMISNLNYSCSHAAKPKFVGIGLRSIIIMYDAEYSFSAHVLLLKNLSFEDMPLSTYIKSNYDIILMFITRIETYNSIKIRYDNWDLMLSIGELCSYLKIVSDNLTNVIPVEQPYMKNSNIFDKFKIFKELVNHLIFYIQNTLFKDNKTD